MMGYKGRLSLAVCSLLFWITSMSIYASLYFWVTLKGPSLALAGQGATLPYGLDPDEAQATATLVVWQPWGVES